MPCKAIAWEAKAVCEKLHNRHSNRYKGEKRDVNLMARECSGMPLSSHGASTKQDYRYHLKMVHVSYFTAALHSSCVPYKAIASYFARYTLLGYDALLS